MLAVTEAFGSVMPMFSSGHAKKRPGSGLFVHHQGCRKVALPHRQVFPFRQSASQGVWRLAEALRSRCDAPKRLLAFSRHSAIRAARAFACSRNVVSSAGQFFSCAGVNLRPAFSAAMRASVKAAKSSDENFGWCPSAFPNASEDAAKTVEDRLGKARSAAVAAIRICFFMRASK